MSAYLSLIGRRRGGRLFEAGRLLTFSAFKMGAYSRWALIRGWALIRINTVVFLFKCIGLVLTLVMILDIFIGKKKALRFTKAKRSSFK